MSCFFVGELLLLEFGGAKAQSVSGFERKYNPSTFRQERDGVKGQMSSVQLEFAFARRGFLRCCRFAL
jgi:hypothetical protein